jgi:hypothetical protein
MDQPYAEQVQVCDEQPCARRVGAVEGKLRRPKRVIETGADEIVEIYEGKDGGLELVTRSTRPALRDTSRPPGDLVPCGPECLERTLQEFDQLLAEFESAQKKPAQKDLPKIDDFRVSRVGVLIHEQCFELYGPKVEQWVTDAVVQGMTCQFNSAAMSKRDGKRGMAYQSHIPRQLNLFRGAQRVDEGAIYMTTLATIIMTSPCEDYKTLPIAKDMKISSNCSYVPEVMLGAPKLICQVDRWSNAASIYSDEIYLDDVRIAGYASGPYNKMPI